MKKKIGIHFIPCIVLMAVLLLCMVLTAGKVSASDFSDETAEEGKYIEEDQTVWSHPNIINFKINNQKILGYDDVLRISFKITNIDIAEDDYNNVGTVCYFHKGTIISVPMKYDPENNTVFGYFFMTPSFQKEFINLMDFIHTIIEGLQKHQTKILLNPNLHFVKIIKTENIELIL